METESQRNKVEAIYQLREAVEAKVAAEHHLEDTASEAARDALLAAQIALESKTQDAIDVCHECGQSHGAAEAHTLRSRVSGRQDNVVHVDFGRESESA